MKEAFVWNKGIAKKPHYLRFFVSKTENVNTCFSCKCPPFRSAVWSEFPKIRFMVPPDQDSAYKFPCSWKEARYTTTAIAEPESRQASDWLITFLRWHR